MSASIPGGTPTPTPYAWANALIYTSMVLAALGVIFRRVLKFKPAKWIWRRLVSEPVSTWARKIVSGIVDERVTKVETTVDSRFATVQRQHDELAAAQSEIRSQLFPNHGDSFHDRVLDRLTAIEPVVGQVEQLSERVAALESATTSAVAVFTTGGTSERSDRPDLRTDDATGP